MVDIKVFLYCKTEGFVRAELIINDFVTETFFGTHIKARMGSAFLPFKFNTCSQWYHFRFRVVFDQDYAFLKHAKVIMTGQVNFMAEEALIPKEIPASDYLALPALGRQNEFRFDYPHMMDVRSVHLYTRDARSGLRVVLICDNQALIDTTLGEDWKGTVRAISLPNLAQKLLPAYDLGPMFVLKRQDILYSQVVISVTVQAKDACLIFGYTNAE